MRGTLRRYRSRAGTGIALKADDVLTFWRFLGRLRGALQTAKTLPTIIGIDPAARQGAAQRPAGRFGGLCFGARRSGARRFIGVIASSTALSSPGSGAEA
jgi:hypothetical protein